ncbi:MAG: hypothetical protein GC204_11775 [Chloroflexi bacterium]|nr:hypothetical protein [Chloroflexota bacterium]
MRKFILIGLLLLVCVNLVHAQAPVITLTLQAGFDGHFRDSQWLPIEIHASNDGDAVSGRLVVRPETSGTGVLNTFSTPITLPTGARQTAFLYVTARSFTSTLRVELIDDAGEVVASKEAPVSAIQPEDRLNVVISDSPIGAVDLTGAHVSGANSYQADWKIADLPVQALDSIDLIMFSDIDTGTLSSPQKQALSDWISTGGHLIVTGGQNWQATAAGLGDLLPLTPSGSQQVDGLQGLSSWMRVDTKLDAQTVIATGTPTADAQVFAALDDGTPLLLRRTLGAGAVDYLAADPNNAPLRGWSGLSALWFALITDGSPQPGWANGFVDWESAARSAEILPGYDPLPDILPLCGFLGIYIALIGPLNYIVLNRINRREWAWVTIPIFILAFSVLSYVLGFNLRGNEATLNRLAVVQTWDDTDRAHVDELVGLLSPRRSQYTMTAAVDDTLRPIPRPLQSTGILTRNTQSSVDIRESDQFAAQDFNVDASFIAGFHLSGMIEKPNISGQASIADDPAVAGQQVVRGSVRNDSSLTLTDPVVLARGVAYQLAQPLAPGDIADFDLTLTGDNAPAPMLRTPVTVNPYFSYRANTSADKQSVIDILGTDRYSSNISRILPNDSFAQQVNRRRQYFLTSFVSDFYNSSGRGDHVYVAGWSENTPLATDISGANWNTQDTTIYLIELDSQRVLPPSGSKVTISPDQFTWVVASYTGLSDVTPVNMQLQPGEEAVFRYTPLPSALLKQVDSLIVNANDTNTGGRSIPFYLWNWETSDWESINVLDEVATINDPARFLGPQNAVQVRLVADEIGGYVRLGKVSVEQTGTF